MNKTQIGRLGEAYAVGLLRAQNYLILDTNYQIRQGEIDIIALSEEGELVFVEVKTRTGGRFGRPEESISHHKAQRLIKTALHFLSQSREKNYNSWRIDLVAVKLRRCFKLQSLSHHKHIFDG